MCSQTPAREFHIGMVVTGLVSIVVHELNTLQGRPRFKCAPCSINHSGGRNGLHDLGDCTPEMKLELPPSKRLRSYIIPIVTLGAGIVLTRC